MRPHIALRLSAQRALLDRVTPNLRVVSCELQEDAVRVRSYFEFDPTEAEREEIAAAGTEIIADYLTEVLDEEILVSAAPLADLDNLAMIVFRRYELT